MKNINYKGGKNAIQLRHVSYKFIMKNQQKA